MAGAETELTYQSENYSMNQSEDDSMNRSENGSMNQSVLGLSKEMGTPRGFIVKKEPKSSASFVTLRPPIRMLW